MRVATCRCGAVKVECAGEPARISVCHCLACQQRTGSAFAAQVRFPASQVSVTGEVRAWTRIADSGNRATYRFCPACGSTIAYGLDHAPETVAVPIGAFADPAAFGTPIFSVYEERKFDWVTVDAPGMEHMD